MKQLWGCLTHRCVSALTSMASVVAWPLHAAPSSPPSVQASRLPRAVRPPSWEDLDAHPDIVASFDALMGPPGHGTPDPEVLVTGGWESVRTVVDIGGGTGALLAEILRARPEIHGTLVDLPRTVARSSEIFEAVGVAERVTTVGQSFFDPLPSGADLYLLRGILNDWPDREATAILSRCAEAAC